jgi:hypothetical protein
MRASFDSEADTYMAGQTFCVRPSMLSLFLARGYSQPYPLLLGVPPDVVADTPSILATPGLLPENLTIFIAVPGAETPVNDIIQLGKWGGASQICEKVGKTLAFPSVEANIFNFLKEMREIYPQELTIDGGNECACKMKYFKGGLVTVKVPDDDLEVVDEVVEKAPPGTAFAFIVASDDLFTL